MKRDVFIILLTFLLVLILIYFYNKREEVLNKRYNDTIRNVTMEYPYFHNPMIDNYINNYLNQFINDNTFVDYDYKNINDSEIELTIYIQQHQDKVIKKTSKRFLINLMNNSIKTANIEDTVDNYFSSYQSNIDKKKKMIALTFDDGPNYNTNRVLNILSKYHIKATFFILGTNISGHETIIKKMKELNMEIGNHMYSHKLLTKLKNNEIEEEIDKVDTIIYDITKEKPTLVRPSYGTFNKRICSLIDRPIILWSIDTLDWKNHNSKLIEKRVMSKISDGDIILMHDIYRATANSLELIIPKLIEKGYQFVTILELLYYKDIPIEKGKIYSKA